MDEREALEYLSEQVRRRALKRGLSVERLADFAGLSRSAVWKCLAGTHEPKLSTVVKLANALGCKPSALLP